MLQNSYLQVKRVLIEWNCKKEANFHVYAMHSSGKEEYSSNSYEKFSKLAKYIFLIYNFICSTNKDKDKTSWRVLEIGIPNLFNTFQLHNTFYIFNKEFGKDREATLLLDKNLQRFVTHVLQARLTNTEVSTHHPFNNIVKCWGKFS